MTGWSPAWVDSGVVPRTWNLIINGVYDAVLRIDQDAKGVLQGRLKGYDNSSVAGPQEELENALDRMAKGRRGLNVLRQAQATKISDITSLGLLSRSSIVQDFL